MQTYAELEVKFQEECFVQILSLLTLNLEARSSISEREVIQACIRKERTSSTVDSGYRPSL